MVRLEAGRVFDHAHPNIPCFKCAPEGCPRFTPLFDRGKLAPIGDSKHDVLDVHDYHVRKSHIRHINSTSSLPPAAALARHKHDPRALPVGALSPTSNYTLAYWMSQRDENCFALEPFGFKRHQARQPDLCSPASPQPIMSQERALVFRLVRSTGRTRKSILRVFYQSRGNRKVRPLEPKTSTRKARVTKQELKTRLRR